jgi:hypothetical protein
MLLFDARGEVCQRAKASAMIPLALKPNTLTALPPLPRPAILAVVLVTIGRFFFLAAPDAFEPYPETQSEYNFYKIDLQCKAQAREAQIVVQGTSRLVLLNDVPLFLKRWHTKDRVLNVSQPLNTFWHMNLLHRRNPGLLDKAELWVIDVVPLQTRVALGFEESDALFLRESTLAERLRVHGIFNRARATADFAFPLWSHHHAVVNWYRALRTLGATPQDRLRILESIDENRLPDITGERVGIDLAPNALRNMFAFVAYPPQSQPSQVQLNAFDELMARRRTDTHLLFIHFPFRDDFGKNIEDLGGMASKKRMREFIQQKSSDRIHAEWYEAPSEMRFVDEDFSPDGFHLTLSGMDKIEKHLARRYREFIPRAEDNSSTEPPQ